MSEQTFENWEMAVARKRVNDARNKWAILKAEGFDDLAQECLLHWLQEKKKYDSNRGASLKTFMARVVNGHLLNIKNALLTNKRRVFFEAVSLHEIIDEDIDSPLKKLIGIEECREKLTQSFDPSIAIDVSIVLQKLTPQQKEICRLIKDEGMSFHQLRKHTQKHSRIITKEIERIRKVFQSAELNAYL